MSDIAKLREMILEKEKEGKVVFAVQGGLMEADIMDFINQPTEGLLYDLNRDKPTVMTFINDPKWINDYAVGLVISKLKEFYDKAR
jgi:hypothetical protein